MIRQEIIRDVNYTIIETIDNDIHIRYNSNGDIIYYKSNNFEYPLPFNDINSLEELEFLNIIEDGIIKIDEVNRPNTICLSKKKKSILRYELKYKIVWFDLDIIWKLFKTPYSMESTQTEEFLKDMMEKHFNCKDITPKAFTEYF